MSKVRWIQLSDLHFGDELPNSKKSREMLPKFVSEHMKHIDYVFVTGDIIFAKNMKTAKQRKSAYKDAETYLKEFCSSVSGQPEPGGDFSKKIFVVPGNHDMVRDAARSSCIGGMLGDYAKEKHGKIDRSYLDNTNQAMKYYDAFYKNVTSNAVEKKVRENMHYVLQTEQLNILHINTCISSGDDGEEGKLIVGFELLNKALDTLDSNKPTVAIAHHNFDCFRNEEQKKLEILLKERNIVLYLCGHAHERESNLILRYNQTKILNTYTCGTLISEEGMNKAVDTVFFYGELDLNSKEGMIRSYKWTLEDGWHDDKDFGLVQKTANNYRTFRSSLDSGRHKLQLEMDNMKGIVSEMVSNQSCERNMAFIGMNGRARQSLSVYGVGITSLTRNTELFDRILKRDGIIRLCMVDPRVFKSQISECPDTSKDNGDAVFLCGLANTNFCIYANHVDDYIRKEYYDDMERSYKRILRYGKRAAGMPGKFQVKLLKSFIPLSINIVNENTEQAELIIEYTMPFTSQRLMLQLNSKDHEYYYNKVSHIFGIIWDTAEELDFSTC